MRPFLLAALIVALCCATDHLVASAPSVRGRIVDPGGLPLPGVTVTLTPADGQPITTASDEDGTYVFVDVPAGRYDVAAALDGFETAIRHGVELATEPLTLDLQLTLATVRQEVTVTAPAVLNVIGSSAPEAPVAVTREVMDIAMLPNSQYDDVLPLMPNVVRGPDGLIAVAGARSVSSGLFVNGQNVSDPLSGGAGVMLPLEAVDTMQVYAGGAPAEFGYATGGVTSVQTRSGSDRFHMSLDSFFPRLLYEEGGVKGVAFWDPNLGFSGPIGSSRITYEQAISYRYDRNRFTTLAGPDHNIFNALLWWTQLDARLTDTQRLRVFLSADPRSTDRANITAFTPGASAPRIAQGGWSTGLSDAIALRSAVLDLHTSLLQTGATVSPDASDAYVLGHQLATGSYFDVQDRRATRVESGMRLTWASGAHVVTAGASVAHASLDQTITGAPISMLRSDGTIARSVTFLPASPATSASTTLSVFAQDRWSVRPWLSLDAGVRSDETTRAGDPPLSPRAGWTLGSPTGRTTLSGSVGLFADALPLNALGFPALPVRQITTFDPAGASWTTTIANVRAANLQVPRALRWDVELDRRLASWTLRVRYEERRGRNELVVVPGASDPGPPSPSFAEDVLAATGRSRARSLETTAGFHAASGNEWYVSYVRASTVGAQNSLDAVEGLARVPFVQENLSGPLPSDVPHRILAWGVLHLPSRVTVAPFLDTRSGFPFTAINDGWLMVGVPDAYRLPWTASLDLSVTRIVGLPHHLPEARVGIKLYNVASVHTEREVQRDIERTDFGARYDPVPRDFSFVFEFLWGRNHRG